jgi:hypothetical protein
VDQGAGDADAILHALGQGVKVLLTDADEVGELLDTVDYLVARGLGDAVSAGEEIQIFVDGNIPVARQGIGDVADQ